MTTELDCLFCGGSGGGFYPYHCSWCNGTGGMDVSKIAKAHGGGGHAHASGASEVIA